MQNLTASESLLTLPPDWILEPVVEKRPIRKNWTKTDLDRLECLAQLESGKATGLGLKLGKGLLALDFDGPSAAKLLEKLAGENDLSDFTKTTAWTSGRPGRKQCLFLVPESEWHRIKTRKILTGVTGDDGKEECLEFRWIGTQSVLPPSLHPSGKPYIWLNNPLQSPPLPAPEWLINLCENWHSEYTGVEKIDLVRFPVRLFKHFGGLMRVWLLARRFDISREKHRGHSKGCGVGKFSLKAAAIILNLKAVTVRVLLREAKKAGLIRNYKLRGDWVKDIYYSSLEKVIALTDLKKLGPVAAIEIDDLANLHIIATEVETQHLQRAAYYRQRQEELLQIKADGLDPQQPTQLIAPTTLLHTCERPARVIWQSDRFTYVKSNFRPYGGSQKAIAEARGISTSTASRHLSNRDRLAASPVRGFRKELSPLVKTQVMEHLPLLKNMPAKLCTEEGLVSMFGEWWKPHCNIYLINHRLVSARRRRGRIQAVIDKGSLLSENTEAKILDNKFLLSDASFLKKEGEPERGKRPAKKPGQGTPKMIMAQQ
ncbi:bifunctional DNA primase/polymerase [Microcoleus sp. D2_18a_D3]|uniref:bifunctional DNA primase/polymerase n=1 Tax=Microcoleus sp. D2_18a_D3 TaxID=3055330 RepID=UPI002FD01C50